MTQASKADESVTKYSKTILCITVIVLQMLSRGNIQKSFKCDRGPIFQVANLNRNFTWFRPLEIHYQPDTTARNGSLDIENQKMKDLPQVSFDRLEKQS